MDNSIIDSELLDFIAPLDLDSESVECEIIRQAEALAEADNMDWLLNKEALV